MNQEWYSFEEAKNFVHNLNLKSGGKPSNIPASPEKVFLNIGWKGWSDFLGNEEHQHYRNEVLTFEEAKKYVIELKLKNVKDWLKYCKSNSRPTNIPAKPQVRYLKEGWKGWADFLGKE